MLRRLLLQMLYSWRGSQNSCSCGWASNIFILQFVGHPLASQSIRFHYIVSLPLLPVLSWFLLHVFRCKRSFLAQSFLTMSVLQIVLSLACSWEVMSWGSFYSAILAISPKLQTFKLRPKWSKLLIKWRASKNIPSTREHMWKVPGARQSLGKSNKLQEARTVGKLQK